MCRLYNILAFICILSFYYGSVSGMECYVCVNQEGNRDKCIKTSMQCLQNQDYCMTIIDYRTPPYWSPLGERARFLSKNCTTEAYCNQLKDAKGHLCNHEWYLDWYCVECCKGELCNYYATLGSSNLKISLLTVCASLFSSWLLLMR